MTLAGVAADVICAVSEAITLVDFIRTLINVLTLCSYFDET